MPISFLTPSQRETYGRYAAPPTPDQLSRFFHLSDDDLQEIRSCRGEHNRLGFALQLSTVRYLGAFLDDLVAVPSEVIGTLAYQLGISNLDRLPEYGTGKQRWDHAARIQISFGYSAIRGLSSNWTENRVKQELSGRFSLDHRPGCAAVAVPP